MSLILSFVNPLEFLLRYTVIAGMVIAAIGAAMCMLAARITNAVRDTEKVNKQDKLYVALMMIGLCLILLGLIVMALPINGTFYGG